MTASSDFKYSVIAGAVSGVVTRIIIEPLDVLKIRFQLQVEHINESSPLSKYKGLKQAVSTILKEEGLAAFWKGQYTGILLYGVYGASQFTVFGQCKTLLQPYEAEWPKAVNFTSGCAAGATATVISQPLDVLRTRFIAQGEPKLYTSIFKSVGMMYKEKGIRTFYRGITPTLLSVIPQAGLHFSLYNLCTIAWESKVSVSDLPKTRTTLCGALAGMTTKILLLPLDTIKKRLEVQGFDTARKAFGTVQHYSGVTNCVISIFRDEGFLAFYKGLYPAILKSGLSTALSFVIFEEVMKSLRTV
eukprot:Em0016g547a